ncbi:phage tail tape measure protein [Phyllobacterium myrsinacearum]|uniref:Phage tail tape measure protein domain-containing protein n=1 Tax=Phyllobacterium myrsinacearum TaxID=28101 RepID=A0A839EN26_9HYPH|nr:phage tail tape measure protein [Phyllobacterium myrsinacearum]MBA8877877.1 hypothetical protein [Phyllobacterium myrsinacearum]
MAALSNRLGIDRISKAVGNLGNRITSLGSALGRTTGRLGLFAGMIGVGGGAISVALFGMVKGVADTGAAISELGFKLGIGAEQLQAYQYAAKISGVESESLAKGIQKLGINAAEASRGNKGLAIGFKSLGVSLKDAHGKMRPMESVLDQTMKKLAKIEDPLRRNQLAFKLFGKSGVDMVKMLSSGSRGLDDLLNEARDSGSIMSQRAADLSGDFGDNIDRLLIKLNGLKTFIAVQLLPVFNDAVLGVTEWYDANKMLIRSTIGEWVKRLTKFMRDLADPASEIRVQLAGVSEGFSSFLAAIRPVVDFVGGPFKATMLGIALWIGGPLISALATIGLAFVNLGIVILSTPIGWMLAGIAALVAAGYMLYQNWDSVVAGISAAWEGLKSYLTGVWASITSAFDGGFIQGITKLLVEFAPATHIARAIDAIFEYFTGISLIDEGTKLVTSFVDGMNSGLVAVQGWIQSLMDEYQRFSTELGLKLFEVGANAIGSFLGGLKSMWGSVVSWFKDSVNDLIGWLPDSLKTSLGFNVTTTGASGATLSPEIDSLARTVGASAATIGSSISMPSPIPTAGPTGTVETGVVQAGTVQATNFVAPSPLLVHQPQSIDASTHVGSIVVQSAQGTPADTQAAVEAALRNHTEAARQQSLSVLSD